MGIFKTIARFISLSFRSFISPNQIPNSNPSNSGPSSSTNCSLKELRGRIDSVKNTEKITEAMKLVSSCSAGERRSPSWWSPETVVFVVVSTMQS
ncbi:hypothetical protein L2E82_15241 [Cichorium intybus]|uniref:Uncharacterized protein n=1 Tax=Cichorium intybus TaxID=13427 RepID=A0ACB9F362_CICIN|nr:hypothetical protein L2E82_15241 [Cichorium intybus]